MGVDGTAIVSSLLGGAMMGSYPVPIKAPRVIKADVNPIVFQCYKSAWACIVGLAFIPVGIIRHATGHHALVYEFTWWAFASAAAWIPSGLCLITAVPRTGVSMAVILATSTSSTLSFVAFWLGFGERMKEETIDGHRVYLAPLYLVCMLLGMVGLVLIPTTTCPCSRRVSTRQPLREGPPLNLDDDVPLAEAIGDAREEAPFARAGATKDLAHGVLAAIGCGFFSAVQFGIVDEGKKVAQRAEGCGEDPSRCPPVLKEQFDVTGSWITSFGLGALMITALLMSGLTGMACIRGVPRPSLKFKILWIPGSVAGLFWAAGNFFQIIAVVQGGSAVMMPINQAFQLLVSGFWGLLYYREVHGCCRILCWSLCAVWLLASMILLGHEKSH